MGNSELFRDTVLCPKTCQIIKAKILKIFGNKLSISLILLASSIAVAKRPDIKVMVKKTLPESIAKEFEYSILICIVYIGVLISFATRSNIFFVR